MAVVKHEENWSTTVTVSKNGVDVDVEGTQAGILMAMIACVETLVTEGDGDLEGIIMTIRKCVGSGGLTSVKHYDN